MLPSFNAYKRLETEVFIAHFPCKHLLYRSVKFSLLLLYALYQVEKFVEIYSAVGTDITDHLSDFFVIVCQAEGNHWVF